MIEFEQLSPELIPLAVSFILFLIIYFFPIKFRTYYVGSHIAGIIKKIFWIFLGLTVFLNFLLFFSQPSYNDKTMSIERRGQNPNVEVKDYATDKTFYFTPKLYKFFVSMPDELYYKDITNFIWDNSFLINSYIILFLTVYVFIFSIILNVKFFRGDY